MTRIFQKGPISLIKCHLNSFSKMIYYIVVLFEEVCASYMKINQLRKSRIGYLAVKYIVNFFNKRFFQNFYVFHLHYIKHIH